MVYLLLALFLSLSTAQTYKGYWDRTWDSIDAPSGTVWNIAVAFSGWTDPTSALSDSGKITLASGANKYISLGGGNANGRWTATALANIKSAITSGKFYNYVGIVFDIEEGDAGLSAAFEDCFKTANIAGKKVLVTVSHSTPYGFTDKNTLMTAILTSNNVHFISPQLYSSGTETANDLTENGIPWSDYSKSPAILIPSVVSASFYNQALINFFTGKGKTPQGFVQWSTSGTSTPPPPPPPSNVPRCGYSWQDAVDICRARCTSNANCPSGQSCFADVSSKQTCGYVATEDVSASSHLMSGLTPTIVGLIVAIVVVVVLLLVVSVLLYKKSNATQMEERA